MPLKLKRAAALITSAQNVRTDLGRKFPELKPQPLDPNMKFNGMKKREGVKGAMSILGADVPTLVRNGDLESAAQCIHRASGMLVGLGVYSENEFRAVARNRTMHAEPSDIPTAA